jgi:hypothetical protein
MRSMAGVEELPRELDFIKISLVLLLIFLSFEFEEVFAIEFNFSSFSIFFSEVSASSGIAEVRILPM